MKKVLLTLAALAIAGSASAGTPTIDGSLDAAAGYFPMAAPSMPLDFTGFGTLIDASALFFTEDATHIYLFVQGMVTDVTSNGIMLLIGTSGEPGHPAGVSGVGGLTGGHAFDGSGGGATIGYKFEFEVDHAWVANNGFAPGTDWYIDHVHMVGGRTVGYTGNSGAAGLPLIGSMGEVHAFKNTGAAGGPGVSTGWEIGIPRAALGGIGAAAIVKAFATVVSETAFFSGDCTPAGVGPNPGFDADYPAVPGVQVATVVTSVPVELSEFSID